MRILVVHPGMHLTGAARFAALSARALHQRGHHVVAAVALGGQAQAEFADRLPAGHVLPLQLPNLRRGVASVAAYVMGVPTGIYALAKIMRDMRPDVVVGHCVFNAWTALAAQLCGIPLVSVVHELPSALPLPLYRLWSGLLSAASHTVVSVSAQVQAALMQVVPTPRHCAVLRPCIDTNVFCESADDGGLREAWLSGSSGPLFVCVSHLMHGKGQQDVIEALPRVLNEFPRARLVFVGGTNEAIVNQAFVHDLHARMRTLGVEAHVVFAGPMPNTQAAIAAADVVVYPSRCESFGLVPVEACAVGRPVVACRVGFAPHLAAMGAPVELADPATPASLAKAMVAAAGRGRVPPFTVPELTPAGAAQELELLLVQAANGARATSRFSITR